MTIMAGSVVVATVLRFEFAVPASGQRGMVMVAIVAALLQLLFCSAAGLYGGRWTYGGFEETAGLAVSLGCTTVALTVLDVTLLRRPVPASACLAAGPLALVAMGGVRYLWRLSGDRRLRPDADHAVRVIVFGAGEGGYQTITALMRNPDSAWLPVAILDDDPTLGHLTIKGVRMAGGRDRLKAVADKNGATAVIIAIPSAPASLIRELSALGEASDLQVLVVPPVSMLFGSALSVDDIRPISEADLLGRHEIDTDLVTIAGYLAGRRVLVTGAGGSIGSELCRQISRLAPAELVMLDRDESALHAVQLSIDGRALLDDRNLVVCDIRDRSGLNAVFTEHRPQVVFHAAALKHLPLLQMHPAEAVKTNVFGTQNMLDVAQRYDVERFVNISTDKAADPCSVLGYSKRIAERLTAATAEQGAGTYLSVRFGNVLGSRGSVLTAFRAQIAGGGPVTVTHPDVTRYFMTVEEAVQLVIQAGAVGAAGEALVLDMGQPVRIDDVARRLIEQADRAIEVEYTGLRDGEKLDEVLLGHGEIDRRPSHQLISQVAVPPLDLGVLEEFLLDAPTRRVIDQIRAISLSVRRQPATRSPGVLVSSRSCATRSSPSSAPVSP